MPGQIELFKGGLKKPSKTPQNLESSPKLRWWDKNPGFWRGQERTKKEHRCSRCEDTIPVGDIIDITLNFQGVKPEHDDFKNVEYWHKNKNCHEK